MGKDTVGYRRAKKFAYLVQEIEEAIGISAYSTTDVARGTSTSPFLFSEDENGFRKKPNALIKWSFDDFCIEEELPPFITDSVCVSSSYENSSCLLPIFSQGISFPTILKALRTALSPSVKFHALSPLDFVSCTKRFIWIREKIDVVKGFLESKKVLSTREGNLFLGSVIEIPVPIQQTYFPVDLLPDFTYTVVMRNVSGSLANLLHPLRHICNNGFLNYSHSARHGMSILQVFDDAKLLLHREFTAFLEHYVQSLSEATPHSSREISSLVDLLHDASTSSSEWEGMQRSIQWAVSADRPFFRRYHTGLYPYHHILLLDMVNRASNLFPKHRDPAVVIRESIRDLILKEKLRSISDVSFNIVASSRWNAFGSKVVVGDLVVPPDSKTSSEKKWRGDAFESHADHLGGCIPSSAEKEWISESEEHGVLNHPHVKVIQSVNEARQYTIHDVVLPLFGRGFDELKIPRNGSENVLLSAIQELSIQGFPQMALSPKASFRHLSRRALVQPSFYVVDENRGWEWAENAASVALKKSLYKDQENVLRMKSPLESFTGKRNIARPGISGEIARRDFLKPIKSGGKTCVLRVTLPRGSSITTFLREVVRTTSFSTSGICKILQ